MTNQLLAHTTSGQTLYAILFNATGQVWNGSAFVAPANANWTDNDLPMAEADTTGIYRATMPAVAAGVYSYLVYQQAGASPAATDTLRGTGSIAWDGTAEIVPASAGAGAAQGRPTLYVSNAGDDDNDGATAATALATLAAAHAAATAGHLIHVLPGTYTDHKLGKDQVDWYCERGVTIQVTAAENDDYIFGDGNNSAVYAVAGHARLIIIGPDDQYSYVHAIKATNATSRLHIQCESITVSEWELSANIVTAYSGAHVTVLAEQDLDASAGNYCALARYGSTVRVTAQRLLGGADKTVYSRDAGSIIILSARELIHMGQGAAVETNDGAHLTAWIDYIHCTDGLPALAANSGAVRIWDARIYASSGCLAATNGIIDLVDCLNPTAHDTTQTGGQVNRITRSIAIYDNIDPAAVPWTYTLRSEINSTPIPNARIEVYTDEAMTHLVNAAYTNAFGQAHFDLDPGPYYIKRIKTGWRFTNPDPETVEAPIP